LDDLPALLVRRFCAKLVTKTGAQAVAAAAEMHRDAARRRALPAAAAAVAAGAPRDAAALGCFEAEAEAAFAVAEANYRLGLTPTAVPADCPSTKSRSSGEAASLSSEQTVHHHHHHHHRHWGRAWHRPEKLQWWSDLGLCLRGLQTACHLLVASSVGDRADGSGAEVEGTGPGQGDQGGAGQGSSWPCELVMRRYVQVLLGARDPTEAHHNGAADALLDTAARLAGRAAPLAGAAADDHSAAPAAPGPAATLGGGGGPSGSGSKSSSPGGEKRRKAAQKTAAAVFAKEAAAAMADRLHRPPSPTVGDAAPTFEKSSADLANVLSTVAMVFGITFDPTSYSVKRALSFFGALNSCLYT
jgi:hypothetical protein